MQTKHPADLSLSLFFCKLLIIMLKHWYFSLRHMFTLFYEITSQVNFSFASNDKIFPNYSLQLTDTPHLHTKSPQIHNIIITIKLFMSTTKCFLLYFSFLASWKWLLLSSPSHHCLFDFSSLCWSIPNISLSYTLFIPFHATLLFNLNVQKLWSISSLQWYPWLTRSHF